MKKCCEQWKDSLWREDNFVASFCPDCGSSLKEESGWCECGKFYKSGLSPYYNMNNPSVCPKCHKPIKPKPKLSDEIKLCGVPGEPYSQQQIDCVVNILNRVIAYLRNNPDEL